MSRPVLLGLAVCILPGLARGDDKPLAVRVVTPDRKPAAGAKVWVYPYTGTSEVPKEPTPLVADDAGKLTVPVAAGKKTSQLFVRDAAGRVGRAWVRAPWEEATDDKGIEVVLLDTAPRNGRVTTADGKPVAGATVTPQSFYAEDRGQREPGGPDPSIYLPEWEQTRLAVKTEADGRFKLTAPVAGYSVYFRVKADGFGETKWSASPNVDLDTPLATPGTLTIAVEGLDPALLKGRGWRLDADDDKNAPGVRPSRWRTGEFDGTAKLTVRDLPPGKYDLRVWAEGAIPGVFVKPEAVEVLPGKAAEVVAKFAPAAKATGRVTDKDGKGVAKVRLVVYVSDGTGPQPHAFLDTETDADGNFTAHGPAGWYSLGFQKLPDGYAEPVPAAPQKRLVEPVKVEAGKAHAFAPVKLLTAVTFSGRVVLADGKPAAGATVSIGNFAFQGRHDEGKGTTNMDGNFAIPNLAPDDAVSPRVRLGSAVNVPETFDLEKHTRPVEITVSEANATGFTGRVLDAKGKPVAGAKVVLRHQLPAVGRKTGIYGYGGVANTATDADGRYAFAGMWPRDVYGVYVTAAGYSPAEGKRITGEAGQTHDFGDTKLTRASLSVTGRVLDPDGKPVAGAEVFGVDGPTRFAAKSAADGTFTLTGFYEGGGFVFAKKAGFRLAAVPVTPGDSKPVTVTLAKAGGNPVPPPEIPAAHRAALDAFTRHALTLVWESHPTFGYGGNALADMARIDLETAKKWRDAEKKRTDGKTDFTRHIDRAVRQKTLLDTAKADPDEALAIIGALKPEDGYYEAKGLCEKLLQTDKAKSLRFAEEAVVKARQWELPSRIYALAEAGDLAARAGNAAGGKKVLAEAAELAAKLEPDERGQNSYAIGLTAAHLAPYDWDRAEELLGKLKDPSDFNRYLGDTAARVARTDLAKAKHLLDRFKPDNSTYPQIARMRVAFAVVADRPDEAVKIVEGVERGPSRAQGYLGLAVRFAKTDKARAVKMIDAAFDLLDRDPEAFRSWSNFGGRAALAAVGAVRAKEIGHPDVPQLVARCLAMRPVGPDIWSPDDRERQTVNLAAVLATIDPATARQLLAAVASPDDYAQKAVSKNRDWLFALAMADPDRAKGLADKLIERAKDARGGRNGLSATGLVELGSILTAPDRLRSLTGYGSLSREIDDD